MFLGNFLPFAFLSMKVPPFDMIETCCFSILTMESCTAGRHQVCLSLVKACVCVCVCVWPQYYKLFPYFSFGNIPLHFKQGAIPLVTGGWPTKRPVARAVNVPADSSWVLVCAAGMSKK